MRGLNSQRFKLMLIPTAMIIIGSAYIWKMFPIYAGAGGYDQDPAYVYFCSGLTLLTGHSPTHIDHPGTPLQVLCALVVALQWLVLRMFGLVNHGLISNALQNPEQYILTISLVLLMLNAIATYYFGRQIFRAISNYRLALLCQLAPLAFWIIAPRIAYLSPEALLIFSSLYLLGLLAPTILATGNLPPNKEDRVPLWIGLVCGFGIAVKLTFIPMLGLVILLGSWGRIFRALIYTGIGWTICILPILGNLKPMAEWIYALLSHSGRYGTGKAEIINFSSAPEQIINLVEAFPFFFLVQAFLLAFLMFAILPRLSHIKLNSNKLKIDSSQNGYVGISKLLTRVQIKTLTVMLSVSALQTALVIKHAGEHYMTPVLPLAFLGVVWSTRVLNTDKMSKIFSESLYTFLFASAFMMTANACYITLKNLNQNRQKLDNSMADIQLSLMQYSNPLVIGTYRCTLPECALSFGLLYSPDLESRAAPLFKNYIEYNIWSKRLHIYGVGWAPLNQLDVYLKSGRDILLLSPSYPELKVFNLQTKVITPYQSLYKITGVIDKVP